MDKTIEILIYLFILSIITEKIVNIVRRYPRNFQVITVLFDIYFLIVTVCSIYNSPLNGFYYLLLLIFLLILTIIITVLLKSFKVKISQNFYSIISLLNPFKNIKKGMIGVNQNTKENEITLLSFIIGFIVALSSNSDFFTFFTKKLSDISPLELNQFFKTWYLFNPMHEFSFTVLLGILATGFFLSFGSKFFYELLELLFQIRNLREKQSNIGTYRVANVEELQQDINLSNEDIVNSVYEREKENVFKISGVNGFSISNINWDGKIKRGLKILTTSPAMIHGQQFQYTMPGGNIYQVPYLPIKAETAIACSSIFPSDGIRNKDMENSFGTLCIPVIDDAKNIYFLSCYHVVKHSSHSWQQFQPNGNTEIIDLRNTATLGNISKAIFNNKIDAALIKKSENIESSDINMSSGLVTLKSTVREITGNDIGSLPVYMKGATTTTVKEGRIVGHSMKRTIVYEGLSEPIQIEKMIEVADKSYANAIAALGDSGALIYDSNGEAIAMIIATDKHRSYAIPIDTILKAFNVTIFKPIQ